MALRHDAQTSDEFAADMPALLTMDDLARLPDEGRGYELRAGRLVHMQPTSGWHGRISMDLGTLINIHAKAQRLGVVLGAETGFVVSKPCEPDTVLAPDVAFIRADRAPTPDSPEWNSYLRLAHRQSGLSGPPRNR